MVIAVYGLTVVLTQTIPPTTVKGPNGSPMAIADCFTLTNSPNTITLSTSSYTYGVINETCSGVPAFTVTSEGAFVASLGGGGCSQFSCTANWFGYQGSSLLNYTVWQTRRCGTNYNEPNGYDLSNISTGANSRDVFFVTLSPGGYVYCLGYYLYPFNTQSSTSLGSFTITWYSP